MATFAASMSGASPKNKRYGVSIIARVLIGPLGENHFSGSFKRIFRDILLNLRCYAMLTQ